MKFIIDKEINLSSVNQGVKSDMLQTKHYANTLLQCIKDAPAGEPYTIGLFGEWGSGKSSVIKTMTENAPSDPNLKNVKIVNYDAWKYSGDSFRRMFLYELRNALGMNESPLMQRFYVNETDETQIKISLNWKKVGLLVAFVVLSILLVVVLKCKFGFQVAIPSTVALIALFFSLWTYIFDQLKMTVQKPLLFAPEQFEDCYKEMVGCSIKWDKFKEKTLKWISFGLHHEQYQRLVIVIDNIDRCQPDIAYSLLTDIKNFLCKEFNVIFVVPVDIYALRKHILKSSSDQFGPEADEFLRKFFNTSIWMKPFQKDELFDYANNLAQRNGLRFKADTVALVANEFATNPRRIIQLFNNLQIELASYETRFAEENQALICKLLIIREEFPHYNRQLLLDPSLFYVDIEEIRAKKEDDRTDIERSILADKRLVPFLIASEGVSTRYLNQEDIVNQVLVNYQTENNIPNSIRQAYRNIDADLLFEYAKDKDKCDQLINYLQDNIKNMVRRGTIESEGRMHFSVLLTLFKSGLLSEDDKSRLMSPLDSTKNLNKILALYSDKESLITLGRDLEEMRLPKLSNVIETEFINKVDDNYSETDIKNLYYAASIWSVNRCRKIASKFFMAFQKDPVGCRQFTYEKEKCAVLFTGDVFNYIFEILAAKDCAEDSSAIHSFQYLCGIEAADKDMMIAFVEKATEKAPSYNFNKPNELIPLQYLRILSSIFAKAHYLGRVIPANTMASLFNRINTAQTFNGRYHSFVSDKASDDISAAVLVDFFVNAHLITTGPIIVNDELKRFMAIDANKDRILDALIELKEQGVDVTPWVNAVIFDNRRTDIRRVDLLKHAFIFKDSKGAYAVPDDVVKKETNELISIIQTDSEGCEILVSMFEDILDDERIDILVREILSGKSIDELKRLPDSLMQRAIASFEKNIAQLSIDKDANILQLIASNGSSEGIEGVWGTINPILADGKNKQPKVINNAIQVLLSFSKITEEQAEALAGNVKALPAAKLSDEKKEEVLNYIRKHVE